MTQESVEITGFPMLETGVAMLRRMGSILPLSVGFMISGFIAFSYWLQAQGDLMVFDMSAEAFEETQRLLPYYWMVAKYAGALTVLIGAALLFEIFKRLISWLRRRAKPAVASS